VAGVSRQRGHRRRVHRIVEGYAETVGGPPARAFLFDCDGIPVSYDERVALAWNQLPPLVGRDFAASEASRSTGRRSSACASRRTSSAAALSDPWETGHGLGEKSTVVAGGGSPPRATEDLRRR
jgi:hypothetical protein